MPVSSRHTCRLPVDGHVHFHQVRWIEPTLDAAIVNFSQVATSATFLSGALLLAESSRERVFEQLHRTSLRRWRIEPVRDEPQTLMATAGERRIAVICGTQVRCSLGLEVLALGTTVRYPEGRDPAETIDRVLSDGALAVVPWGFGKWIGRAGERMRDLFHTRSPDSLFAGDNGGRLQALGTPKALRSASDAGFRVLPGTDPFPFGADYRRVGSFGFLAAVDPDPKLPWHSLRSWLESDEGAPEPYGRALNPMRFVFNQSWIQLHNRVTPGRAAS